MTFACSEKQEGFEPYLVPEEVFEVLMKIRHIIDCNRAKERQNDHCRKYSVSEGLQNRSKQVSEAL